MPGDGSFERQWRARFKSFASERDDDAGIAGWSETGLSARLRAFRRAWTEQRAGSLWLDAGCGAGSYVRMLTELGHHAVGLDYSYVTITKARERCATEVRWLAGDATKLPFRKHCFDGILLFGVTQALSESRKAVTELVRATAAGGQVWVDGLNSWCLPHVFERFKRRLIRKPVHVRYESPFQLRAYMIEAGLKNVRLIWLPILPSGMQRWQPLVESRVAQWIFRTIPGVGALLSHSMIVCGEVDAHGND